eukprot:COSAG01_NODE_56049_length_321_cov_0.599099_1_plen_35_part_10
MLGAGRFMQGAQPGQGGTNAPLRGWKTQLYEGGIR